MSYSMLDDDPRGFRKKKSVGARLLKLHSLVAWLLVFALAFVFWNTRTSLMKQVAELKDFSDSTQSETFEKISKMNENIGAKNREIAELTRAQRADRKAISQCEVEKSNLISERDQLSAKYDACTKETQSLRKNLESLRVEAEQNQQVHTDSHQMKDTRIQDLEKQIASLADQLHAQRNANLQEKQQQQNVNADPQAATPQDSAQQQQQQAEKQMQQQSSSRVEAGNVNNAQQKGMQQEQQQDFAIKQKGDETREEQVNNGNIRITHLPDDGPDVVSGREREKKPLPKHRGRKKKSMGMLKEHMGIHLDDEY